MVVRRPPPELSDFPSVGLGGAEIWRVTRQPHGHGPWWYASLPPPRQGDDGRFDLFQPDGTCYWARAWLVAAAEVLLRDADEEGLLPTSILTERVLVQDAAPSCLLADMLRPEAAGHGVTTELMAGPGPYAVHQQWAARLSEHLQGVQYASRQFPSGRNVAFFGSAGLENRDCDDVRPLSELRDELETNLRLRFNDPPRLADLRPAIDDET